LETVLFYAAVGLAILVLLKIITAPIRLAAKLLINTTCGYALLFLFNLFSSVTGFTVTLNLLAAALIGFLGLPGFGLLLILRYLALL
jgi:inhibitor of the pro-sigma K processing machinery